jgi:hypothetical protein
LHLLGQPNTCLARQYCEQPIYGAAGTCVFYDIGARVGDGGGAILGTCFPRTPVPAIGAWDFSVSQQAETTVVETRSVSHAPCSSAM